ncbi:MAG: DUF4149 domain-containing protein [Halobacteriales archaeon]
MTLVETLLAVLVHGGLGAWLGAMAFFSFVGAPTAFRTLDDADAGTYVNATFPTYYAVGGALGAVALLSWAGLAALGGFDPATLAGLAATLLGVGAFVYSRWVLVPKMERAGDDAFERYHRRSVLLNGTAMLAVAAALVAAHV